MKVIPREGSKAAHIDYTDEVDRGADLLDRIMPGWENKVVMKELDVSSSVYCVLGQLAATKLFREIFHESGYYGAGVDAITKVRKEHPEYFPVPWASERYGFALSVAASKAAGVHNIDPWHDLTERWLKKIRDKRKLNREIKKTLSEIEQAGETIRMIKEAAVSVS